MQKLKKVIKINSEEKKELENIKKQINNNGGEISITRLIEDSIHIFITYYGKEAVKKYSPNYQLKTE